MNMLANKKQISESAVYSPEAEEWILVERKNRAKPSMTSKMTSKTKKPLSAKSRTKQNNRTSKPTYGKRSAPVNVGPVKQWI